MDDQQHRSELELKSVFQAAGFIAQDKDAQLYHLSKTLARADSLEVLLERIARYVVEYLDVSFAQILVKGEGEFFTLAAAFGRELRESSPGATEPIFTQRIYSRVSRQSVPLVISGRQGSLSLDEGRILRWLNADTICLVPIRKDETRSGILLIGYAQGGIERLFHDGQLRMARLIGEQAVAALQRASQGEKTGPAHMETILSLAQVIQAWDPMLGGHSEGMVDLCKRCAERYGCLPAEVETIVLAAMLHDLGKIAVPDQVLGKPGPISPEEWQLMKRHPDVGAELLLSFTHLTDVADIIRSHHEHYDGSGYPQGLSCNWIPLGARILAVVDAYDAIVTGRIYSRARSHDQAIEEIRRCSGTHFDPIVTAVFLALFN